MTRNQALAAAVAAEHETVYGYGVAGAHLRGGPRHAALAALDVHRRRRDTLVQLLEAARVAPPAAAVAYALPFPVTDPTSARRLAARLEDGCAGAAWDVVATTAAGTPARVLGVRWLADAAARAAYWRGSALGGPALPGAPA